jgi:hypothetical protein
MKATDTYISREDRFSLGVDEDSGTPYASFPVSNGIADYEEYYALTREQYQAFLADPASALSFVEEARAHRHDDLLLQKPGGSRGTPV